MCMCVRVCVTEEQREDRRAQVFSNLNFYRHTYVHLDLSLGMGVKMMFFNEINLDSALIYVQTSNHLFAE